MTPLEVKVTLGVALARGFGPRAPAPPRVLSLTYGRKHVNILKVDGFISQFMA